MMTPHIISNGLHQLLEPSLLKAEKSDTGKFKSLLKAR